MKELEEYQRPANVADFVAEVGVDPALGLSRDDAMTRRALYGANRVTPPVNCPSWVCCLLPCLMRTASMQAYQEALPREATVRRRVAAMQNQPATRRMRMDAMSLVYGDVVELKAGDVAGADLRVIECSNDCVVDQSTLVGDDNEDEEGGSRKHVTSDTPPLHLQQDPLRCGNIVPMTASVLQGTAVAVVVSTGDHTLWGRMVTHHEWPPTPGTMLRSKEKGDEEEQTSLIV
ncbi:Carbohydrate-binding protein [Phytophthora palmivora]|uniref:Carbohydrate-binding protein n=1 Tax=Phytophthora palmivora TaxID=4796 RepID=A0A2P4YJV0_9STRA|nr:Carbohydrate-binding protein [Phytophthora palmivora]